MSRTQNRSRPEHDAYHKARVRCQDPRNKSFKNYGGRGIEFRFRSVGELVAVIGKRPGLGYSLDRIDNDGHYEPGNVRWATIIQQNRNQRTSKFLTLNGVRQTVADWADQLGIRRGLIHCRTFIGWCDSCALTLPVNGRCAHRKVGMTKALDAETSG